MFQLRSIPYPKSIQKKVCSALFSSAVVHKTEELQTDRLQEEKIKVAKWDINYLKVGNGSHTLLCMPGALGSIWTDFTPQIEEINKDKFTIVAWDPLGYGNSRPPERDFSSDFYEKDADFAYELMKALHIPKYSLLGWSGGGISSMILAAKHPEAVRKLVVWGTSATILPNEIDMYQKIKDVNLWSRRMREPMIAVYGEELFSKYWAKWVDAMTTLFNENNGDICSSMLKNIKCPTFILYGQKDPMVDGSQVARLQNSIQDSRIHLYPNGKHNIHIAYAEDFNKRIEEFLLK